VRRNTCYFSPCSLSFVLSGEYIQYSPLIFTCNVFAAQKNEKKTTSRRQFGIENYFYSESLTQPRSVKNKYRLFWGNEGICVYSPRRCAPRWINHISPRCLKITYTYCRVAVVVRNCGCRLLSKQLLADKWLENML
jgi:hypothetical protein